MPVLHYNSTNNTLVFNDPIQTVSGLSTAEYTPLASRSQAQFRKAVQIGILNDSQFTPNDASTRRPCDPQHTDVSNKRNDSNHRYIGGEGRRDEFSTATKNTQHL